MDCTDLCSEFFSFAQHKRALEERSGLHHHAWCASSDDFVLLKLRREAAEEGAFLVRWSALDYRGIILAVLNKNEVSPRAHASSLEVTRPW